MEWLKEWFRKDTPPDTPPAQASTAILLPADWQMPASGRVVPITDIADPAFSQGMMGQGFAIRADVPIIVSPVSGHIEAVFPGGHAIGIIADNGAELLLHIGIDSVNLKGEGFTLHCQQGAKVRPGDKLVEADFALLESRLPDAAVLVVFPNITDGEIVIENARPVWQAKDSA